MSDPRPLLAAVCSKPNRGTTHFFLGDERSAGCDKTTVEPGNVTSPGVWTCGISVWFESAAGAASAELLADDAVFWALATDDGPVALSQYSAGGIEVIHRTCHLGGEGAEGCDFHEVTGTLAAEAPAATPCIVVRDIGPAGAKIASLAWSDGSLLINGGIRLTPGDANATCEIVTADATHDSPLAIIRLTPLAPGGAMVINYKVEHAFAGHPSARDAPLRRPFADVSVYDGFRRTQNAWPAALPARLYAPDPRIAATWERCAYHVLAAMECSLPRIGAVNYPHLWLRDGVIVLRALDLIGRHDLALAGNIHIAPIIFSGGFGAEADAPGQGIWCLVRHGIMTKNHAFLRDVFPLIQDRARWIERMRTTDRPLYAVGQNRIPLCTDTAGINTVCYAARNGTIHGRMDWHTPDFFINCWSIAGLAMAAEAAALLGHTRVADEYAAAAKDLDAAVARELLPAYGNERDPIITPYPSGALAAQRAMLSAKFEAWYRAHRLAADGGRKAERMWTYFEPAQAHNALLLGLPQLAWPTIDGLLDDAGTTAIYGEGSPTGNEHLPFRNGERRRGWLDPGRAPSGNMPHNWTSAEMLTLLRDMLVTETAGEIVLGLGVPRGWRMPGAMWGVNNLPTDRGEVTYRAEVGNDGKVHVDYHGPGPWRAAWDAVP